MNISFLRFCLLKSFVLILLLNFSSCKQPTENVEPAPDTVRVMSFNVLYGGDEIDFAKVVESIQLANPDIIGIQEAEGNIPKLAQALGWKYFDSRLHLLSKYPLISDSTNGWYYSFVEIRPGKIIAISNVHLPSDPYGPELVRDGFSLDSVLANEMSIRFHELDEYRKVLPPLANLGIPVLLTGDFNAPSHRDWTTAEQLLRPHMKYAFEWPVSKNLEELGFIDTYRKFHSDPVKKPGLTWTPGYPPPHTEETETHDRIDFIWAKGIEQVINAQLVGEENGPDVDYAVKPFASDHRGVIVTCTMVPAPIHNFVQAYPRISNVSDSLFIQCSYTSKSPAKLLIWNESNAEIKRVENLKQGSSHLWIDLGVAGKFRIELKDQSGSTLASNTFWRIHHDGKPILSLAKNSFQTGEPITVEWNNAPGHRLDWIAIYPSQIDLNTEYNKTTQYSQYLVYNYTTGDVNGSLILSERAKLRNPDSWPLKPGKYNIHLLLDDGYQSLVSVPISIHSQTN